MSPSDCLHVPVVLTTGVLHDHAECLLCGQTLGVEEVSAMNDDNVIVLGNN